MNQAPVSRRGYRRLWAHDPRYGRRYIELLRARVEHEGGGYLLRTNSAGFRCRHEFMPDRPPGRRRVLLFGNSFTAGTGVSDGMRWGDRLERMLGDVDVYNFAIAGSGLDEQLLVHRCHGASLDYDLAVIGLWTDTIYRVTARYALLRADDETKWYRPKAYFTLGRGDSLDLHNVPVPHAAIRQDELPEAQRRFAPEPARSARQRRGLRRSRPDAPVDGALRRRRRHCARSFTSPDGLPASGAPRPTLHG
jgi:hypothetical protein